MVHNALGLSDGLCHTGDCKVRDDHKSWYANGPKSTDEWRGGFSGLPLKERIRLAKEHSAHEGQRNDALWPHQRFALSLGELLDAAERGA